MRLFLALWPEPALAEALARRAATLAGRTGGRPIPAERIHLTVAFLGDQPDETAAVAAVEAVTLPGPMDLRLDRLGVFAQASVLWIGPQDPPSDLLTLNSDLREALAARDVPLSGAFQPHVTLVRRLRHAGAVGADPEEAGALDWTADTLHLVESRAGARGPVYRSRRRWPLAG